MKKKVCYLDMLKQAVSEYDASTMDYQGPMLDNIIGYDGQESGDELKTHKDASDILNSKYVQEKVSEYGFVIREDAQEQEPEENEVSTGDEPDEIDDTLDDLEDLITDGEDGSFDTEFVTNESIEEIVLSRIIQEMEGDEGPDNEIEMPEDEEGDQAGQDAFDKEDDALEDFLDEDSDIEDDFATSNNKKEEDDLNTASDKPLDISEALSFLDEDLDFDFLDEDTLLEDLLFEEDDEHEDKETKEEEKEEHEPGGEEADEKEEDEDKEEPLDVDKDVVKKEGRGMGPIRITKEELLEEAYRLFCEQVQDELEKENDKTENSDEDKDKKEDDKKDKDEEVSDKEIEKKISEALKLKKIRAILFEEEDAQEQAPEENEIITGDTPDKVEATKDDLEDQLLEALFLEDIDDVDVPEEKDEEKEDNKKEDDDENKDEKKLEECKEDFLFDDDLDYLTEDDDLINEILNTL